MIEKDILEMAEKTIQGLEIMDGKNYSENRNFVCPFCNYSSENCRKGSAKIMNGIFECFCCFEKRRVV